MIFDSRSRTRVWLAALLLVLICFAVERPEVRGDSSTETAEAPADLSAALESCFKQEQGHHWIDAIDGYEKAVKQWPDSKELKWGLRRSKIHFGVERRYNDGSFENQLLRLPRYAALDLFSDVLEHIRLYYVDEVSPTAFVAHGTESLYTALTDEKFLRRNLRQADPERVNRLRRSLRERFWNRPVADYSTARDLVSEVCDVAAAEAGLADTPIILEYVFGGCNCLDEYSNFLTPDRYSDLHGSINGEFVGLGIEMKAEAGRGMFLVNVLPDSPAEQGGLRPGDYITRINGTNCLEMTTDEAAKYLRGKQGTRVTLMIQNSENQQRQGEFIRRAVDVKSVPVAAIVNRQKGIAYIRMTGFQSTSPRELDAALSRLSREGMRSLIWDLRGNPGGLLPAATSVLDRFIDSGVLVSTRGRDLEQNQSYSASPHPKYGIPLVLLVDGDSASASEIVAGAIRDHKRGTIIGRKTYGKWSVQTIYLMHMPEGSGLRLTTAKFYSPDGHNLSKVGVQPDVPVVAETEQQHTAYKNPPSMKPGSGAREANSPVTHGRAAHRSLLGSRTAPGIDDPDMKAALDVLEHRFQTTER